MNIIKPIILTLFALMATLACAANSDMTAPDAPTQPAPTADATSPPSASAVRESTPSDDGDFRTLDTENLEIVTLLGFDAIPAILEPDFVDAAQADEWLDDDDLIIGVSINGDSRAYSVPMLSAHEIVNDVVGGEPVAVTW